MAHEDYMAPQMSYARLGALHYFPPGPSIELEPVMKDVHGVLVGICGLGVLAGQQGDPLAKARVHSEIERAAVSILILHSPIEGLVSQDYDIRDSRVARSTLASQPSFRYILAGYHHRYQHLHIGNTDMIVAGATEHIDWNDPDDEPGFVFLGLAADSMRWCHHMTGNALQLRRLVIRTTELWPEHTPKDTDTEESNTRLPTDIVLEQLRPLCAADSILQLHLVGELTRHQYHQLDVNQIRRYGEEHCFELALDESGLSILPIDSYLALGALSRAQWSAYQSVAPTNPLLQSGSTSEPALSGNEGEASSGERARPLSAAMLEERLSPREELINLADEWIAATDVAPGTSSGEKKALIATKEELLAALDRMKRS